MKKRRFGKRSFAAFLAASMILSASTELVSAKTAAVSEQNSAVSDVSDASSTAVASTEKSSASVTVVAEGASLTAVKVPSGLSGLGTKEKPYQIGNIDDLLRMNEYINYEKSAAKHFVLTADIDLSLAYFPALDAKDFAKKSDFKEYNGIYSIVSAMPSLSGNANVFFHLNGNGHVFKNLNVSVPAGVRAAALFGYLGANSVIENVTFKNCRLKVESGTDGAYALIAVQNFGKISKVTVSDCTVDARQDAPATDDGAQLSLECGKVSKGISLVAADNVGAIASVKIQASDTNSGIFVKDAVGYVGAAAGQNRRSISGVTVDGVRILAYGAKDSLSSISGNGACARYIGMIAGSNDGAGVKKTASVTDCTVTLSHGSDLMFGACVGGLVGLNAGSISKCSVVGTCSAVSQPANIVGAGCFGGLVGLNRGSVVSSGSDAVGFAFSGSTAQPVYGGIVGENEGSVQKCASSGYVYVQDKQNAVGGIVGRMNAGAVSENYSFVSVSSDTPSSGAILGKDGTLSSLGGTNYWIDASQGFGSAVPNAGAALNTLQADTTFLNIPAGDTGMRFAGDALHHAWSGSDAKAVLDLSAPIRSDNSAIHVEKSADAFTVKSHVSGAYGTISYAVQIRLPSGVGTGKVYSARISVPVLVTDSANRGAGLSVANPIILTSYEQFKFIRIAPNAHYALGADFTIGADWTPIAFGGTLNGCGHTLTVSGGLFASVSGSRDAAVSGSAWVSDPSNLAAGVVRDLHVRASGTVRGSLLGFVENATLNQITYDAAGKDDFVVLSSVASGAVADRFSGNIYAHNIYVSVPITVTASASEGIGAVVGSVSANVLRMDNCGSSSVLALDGYNLVKVGGLVGHLAALTDGKITNCYASGSVYVRPAVKAVKANIMIGGVSSVAYKHLKLAQCYFSVAESAVEGASVALKAADFKSGGIISLSAGRRTYIIDANGKQETDVVFSLPEELDACRDVQAGDVSFVFENEDMFVSSDVEVDGSDITVGVKAQADAADEASSAFTVVHEPTGLIITEDLLTDVAAEPDPDPNTGYYMIQNLGNLQYIADNWADYYTESLMLCADIDVGTAQSYGSLDSNGDYIPFAPAESGSTFSYYPFCGLFIGADATDPTYSANDTDNDGIFSIRYVHIDGNGLFGCTDGAYFENFGLDSIEVENDTMGTGVLVGIADNTDSGPSGAATSFSNITISNCSVSSSYACEEFYYLGDEDWKDVYYVAGVGTLAGCLCGTADYYIDYITVTDTTVSDTEDYAYGVGGLIGAAFCNTDTYTLIGTNGTYADKTYGILLDGVTVEGYGGVGGALGMAGNFPVDADSITFLYGTDDSNYEIASYMGSLNIENVSVVNGSDIYATTEVCGGILGSEMAGYAEFNTEADVGVAIRYCEVSDSSISTDASVMGATNYYASCGGIAGYCGGTIEECTVDDSTITSVTAGGIVGRPSRKHYYYASATNLVVQNCNVLGSTQITSGLSEGLHLGGIVATAMNTLLTVTGCGVGSDVQIQGNTQYIGGFVGAVISTDENASLDWYYVNILKSVFDGSAQIPTAAQIADKTVGGCIGYAQIDRKCLLIKNNYLGGSLQNAGLCGGIIGQYLATQPSQLDGAAPWIIGCTVTALLNEGVTTANQTYKLVAGLGSASTTFYSNNAFYNSICHGNIISTYPQDCPAYGIFTNGTSLGSTQYRRTYLDINRPDSNGANDPSAAYFTGRTPAQGAWPIDNSAQNGNPVTVTIASNNLISKMSLADSGVQYRTLLSGDAAIVWDVSNDTMLEVSATNYVSQSKLVVTGLASSGTSPVYVTGSFEVKYYDSDLSSAVNYVIPGTADNATILIGAPFQCINFNTQHTFTEQDGWVLIQNYDDLASLEGRIENSNLNQNYKVVANISLAGRDFHPIPGTFSGTFKCDSYDTNQYYKIQNWTRSNSDASAGIFEEADGATFEDVCLDNITLTTSGNNAGALVGTATDTTFTNIKITNTGVSASLYAGLVAAEVTDCTANGITLTTDTVSGAQFVGGVFGHAAKSTSEATNSIQNVTSTNVSVSSTSDGSSYVDYAGGIAAEFSGAISGCLVQRTSGSSSITGSSAAGIVGTVIGNTTIQNSTVKNATITSSNPSISSKAAGVVAEHTTGTLGVSGCTVNSAVTSGSFTGGILAYTSALADVSMNLNIVGGTLTGSNSETTSAVGGLIGLATGSATSGALANSVYYATLTGAGYNGAVVGKVGPISGAPTTLATAAVTNFYYSSYQIASIVLVGSATSFTVSSLYDVQTALTYVTNEATNPIGCGKVLQFINYNSSTYTLDTTKFTLPTGASGIYKNFTAATNVPFELDTVVFSSGSSLNKSTNVLTLTSRNGDDVGVFTFTNGIQITFTVHVSDIAGTGDQDDPYVIVNPGQFAHMCKKENGVYVNLNKFFELGDDLDMSDAAYNFASTIWATDDWRDMEFAGTLDGKSFTISNLTLSDSTRKYVGFFCKFKGTLKDVTFSNCSVTSTYSADTLAATGIVAGRNDGTIRNVTVTNPTVSGVRHVGGIAGTSFGQVTTTNGVRCGAIHGCTVQRVSDNAQFVSLITSSHCAGGIVGGGFSATGCTVSGVTVSANEMAGGIAGGTLSFSNEVDRTEFPSNYETYRSYGQTVLFDNSTVNNTTVETKDVNQVGYAGGVLGIAEQGNSGHYRSVSVCNSTVNAGTTVTAKALANTSGQSNYAGGIVGYLQTYHEGFLIKNCQVYSAVTANGCAQSSDKTAAGGLLGATVSSQTFKFRSGSPLAVSFSWDYNVVNCTIHSAKYAGGVIGTFAAGVYADFSTNCRLASGDSFIANNILAAKFVSVNDAVGNSTDATHFGIIAGLLSPSGGATKLMPSGVTATDVTSENFYSSDVSCKSDEISLFGTGSTVTTCTIYDVSKDANGLTSFKVSNYNDGAFQSVVDGDRTAGSYTMPISLVFNGKTTDLGIENNTISVTDGTRTRYLALTDVAIDPSDSIDRHFYDSSFTTVTANGITTYASYFTVGSDVANCNEPTSLVADLGYGLLVYIPVNTAYGDGTSAHPYEIADEEDFADYFFSDWSANASNRYLTRHYKQTADLNFATILSEIRANLGSNAQFAPIGTANTPFTGGYDGGGYRIVGFTYNGTDANTGLFGYVGSGAKLVDIHIELTDAGVTGGNVTGGLVGYYASAEPIINCSVLYGTVRAERVNTSADVFAGGLIGETSGNVTLRHCFTSTDVSVANQTDANDSTKAYVYAAGGLIGFNSSGKTTFDRSFSSADVVGSRMVGGFLGGLQDYCEVDISNCYSTASVTSLRHLDEDPATILISRPVPLVIGYMRSVSGSNQGYTYYDHTGLDPYVKAVNLYVAGPNTTEFKGKTGDFSYVSLFGLEETKSGTSNVYYDAEVIGRLNFTAADTADGDTVKVGFIKVDGTLHNASNESASITNASISAMYKKTSDLIDMTSSSFTTVNGLAASSVWDTGNANLYPVLNMYKSTYQLVDGNNVPVADPYSQAVAQMAAIPIFLDPREADDSADGGKRTYTGITYPVSLATHLNADTQLNFASSIYSEQSNNSSYPNTYDLNLSSTKISSRSWSLNSSDSSYSYAVTAVNASKNADLLFKNLDATATTPGAPASGATDVTLLRNSYLDYGNSKASVDRNQKSPCVYVWTTLNGYRICRAIRIPLRGEKSTFFVATERQLRAITGYSTETSAKFQSYQKVTQDTSVVGKTGTNVLICADIELNPSVSFTPISGYQYEAVGSTEIGFDGGNCEISNMVINVVQDIDDTNDDEVGMFSTLEGSGIKIQNVILRDVQVTGANYVGALVGKIETPQGEGNKACEILNCMVVKSENNTTSNVTGSGNYVGGLIGQATRAQINCVDSGDGIESTSVTSDSSTLNVAKKMVTGASVPVYGNKSVGGLVGEMSNVKAANCFANGDVTYNGETGSNHDITALGNRLTYGGFAGNIVNDSVVTYCFASGNVTVDLPNVNNNLNGPLYVGVGGFAGASAIAIDKCFSTGDVNGSASSYTVSSAFATAEIIHGIGGLVGYTSAEVTDSYSTSAVSSDSSTATKTKIGVGGVVGYTGSSVDSVYSSGSVSVQEITNISSVGSGLYIGGAVGFADSATKAYFDRWTNFITGLNAVGNLTGSSLKSFTTEEFCSGDLVRGSRDLSATVWDYDPYLDRGDSSYHSNTYPYLKIFFDEEHAVSDYIRFPAALSVVAVRPSDRDESARSGEGYTMAVTIPEYVQVRGADDASGNTTRVQYYLASGAVGSDVVRYGKTVYAPHRTQNGTEDVRLQIWVNSYKVIAESGSGNNITIAYQTNHEGYYDQSDNTGTLVTAANLQTIRENAKETYAPRIGQYVTLSQGYKEYGVRSVHRVFRLMLGTTKYPYLITSASELASIYFIDGHSVATGTHTYSDYWFSQQQYNSSLDKYVNVTKNTDTTQNPANDSVVHFRLMININMKDGNGDPITFTPIGSMSGFTFTPEVGDPITFQGYELDGNDYAIVNFTSGNTFVGTLDAASTIKNLIFSGATLGGVSAASDLALVGTNNGMINGLMLLQNDTDQSNSVDKNSTITTTGSAAGLVVTNGSTGTITQSVVQGTITAGASGKYVGGIAAVNNGTITDCVSAADLSAKAGTVAIGGLVGKNGADGTVSDSFTLGSVSLVNENNNNNTTTYLGGLVGENAGSVANAYSRTVVSGTTVGRTGSFVGTNSGTITDSFSAGTMTISGADAKSVGSAFAGTNSVALTTAFADKALLTSSTYMLVGDAETTENIMDLSAFSTGNTAYTKTTATAQSQIPVGYPQLATILALDENQTYTIGGVTDAYTMLKVRLLQAYSALSSVTVDTPYGNYIDAIPASTISSGLAYTNVVAGVKTTATIASTDTTGTVSATSAQLAQKIGAGSNTIDDLKYALGFSFDFEVSADVIDENSILPSNPNFPQGGNGSEDHPYIIGTNSTYSAENSFGSLAYFGRASDPAYFSMATDVSYNGTDTYEVSNTTYDYSLKDYPITVFRGVLNGNGYTVNDLTLSKGGLLGSLKTGATVQNLGLAGVNMSVTPTANGNYGLLANEAIGTIASPVTVQNVYAVGELKIEYPNNETQYATNVGGLIGYTENASVSHVVTSGYIRNDSTETGSTVGGVIGAMGSSTASGGTLNVAESTAYVYGEEIIGGIVGQETGSTQISNVIFAGTAADTYMTTYRASNNTTEDDSASISHIVAVSDGGAPTGVAKYDRQLALWSEDSDLAESTLALAQYSAASLFTSTDSSKYYARPVGLNSVSSPSNAFTAGLNFALARITVSLAGGEGDIFAYDQITVASPVNQTADTVSITETRADSNTYLNQDSSASLSPKGGANGFTGVTAALNTGANASFTGNVNAIYRYLEANIVRVIYVEYVIDDTACDTGHKLGDNTKVSVMLRPELRRQVSSNALTSINEDSVHNDTVRFRQLVTSGNSTIGVHTILPNTILPNGYKYTVTAKQSDGQGGYVTVPVTGGKLVCPVANADYNESLPLIIQVNVDEADPNWGLQNRSGVVTPVQ